MGSGVVRNKIEVIERCLASIREECMLQITKEEGFRVVWDESKKHLDKNLA